MPPCQLAPALLARKDRLPKLLHVHSLPRAQDVGLVHVPMGRHHPPGHAAHLLAAAEWLGTHASLPFERILTAHIGIKAS